MRQNADRPIGQLRDFQLPSFLRQVLFMYNLFLAILDNYTALGGDFVLALLLDYGFLKSRAVVRIKRRGIFVPTNICDVMMCSAADVTSFPETWNHVKIRLFFFFFQVWNQISHCGSFCLNCSSVISTKTSYHGRTMRESSNYSTQRRWPDCGAWGRTSTTWTTINYPEPWGQ